MGLLELCGVLRLGLGLRRLCWRATLLSERAQLFVRGFCSLRHLEGESHAIYAGQYTSEGNLGIAADVLTGSVMTFISQ